MSRDLPARVAGAYYAHGLFLSSHPITAISIAISVVLLCSYPLVNLPMPGNAPKTVINNTVVPVNDTETSVLYVQQVLLRVGVVPWAEDLTLMDAFRGPLYEVFNLLEIIQNYQHPDTLRTLGQVCLHIEAVKKRNGKKPEILPEYNCLVLSPANLWQQSIELFSQDTNLINTIFSYQNFQKGKISLAEVMFGMNLKETGAKRYPIRIRQRILQYAVTIYLKEYDHEFIKGLQHRLKSYYKLHQNVDNVTHDEVLNVFYPGEFNYSEFFPLAMALLAIFFYMYYSVRKIEMVKSKIGIAFSASMTVMGSVSMTMGVCFFFGLTFSMSFKEVFPYLVILGLENVVVFTTKVISAPAHFDVKIHFAQGLAKEGWGITKMLLIQVTIMTIGLFTFVPVIQKFCISALVGLMSDIFLQLVFYSTVLAIDIRRSELSSENPAKFHLSYIPRRQQFTTTITSRKPHIFRSKSHPKLNGLYTGPTNVIAPNTQNTHATSKIPKRLKLVNFWARTRFFQRMFMMLMVVWISEIFYESGIVEDLMHLSDTVKQESDIGVGYTIDRPQSLSNYVELNTVISVPPATIDRLNEQDLTNNATEELNKLKPVNFPPWNRLSPYHWSSILAMYNVSIAGGRVTILPTIKLSHAMNPQFVKQISNPSDVQHFQWQSLATAALDPLDFSDMELPSRSETRIFNTDAPFVPSSPMEIFLAALLCFISVIVVAYTMVVLYRCVCSRNYAEWRTSWHKQDKTQDSVTQLVLEAMPLVLEGHTQEVECIATDGNTVASACLAGHIKVWDSTSGEQLAHIDRRQFFSSPRKIPSRTPPDADELMSDYESGSPPSRGEMEAANSMVGFYSPAVYQRKLSPAYNVQPVNNNHHHHHQQQQQQLHHHHHYHHKRRSVGNTSDYEYQINEVNKQSWLRRSLDSTYDIPDLKSTVNIRFSSVKFTPAQQNYDQGFDFGERYRGLLERHNRSLEEMQMSRTREQPSMPQARLNRNGLVDSASSSISTEQTTQVSHATSVIWCMDYQENLIVAGCANGSLEFWEGTTGRFKCIFDDGSELGITAVKLVGSRVVAAKLNGAVDFLQLESYSEGQQIDWGFTSYRRTHVRTGSAGSPMDLNSMQTEEDLRCMKICMQRAHQQVITVLDCDHEHVITGSQDHTLKVHSLEDQRLKYTFHGHSGPISCLFIDRINSSTFGSGSQNGVLCVWDLNGTGTCVYSIQAHDGAIAAVTCSVSYVISIGTDERLCVWERFQGHLLHTLPAHRAAYSLQLVMLTHHLLITSNQGSLVVWDVRTGEPVREVRLGHKDSCIFVKQMLALRDSVVCDFGRQLRIVRFPLVSDKMD
ncbi:PREDICTED: sterol regulatory element-binding protein cleavage-activating protein [Dinoponera quadriceps]|uniref:Sterol regulatory element-binding protein cleavage-activating protein n=1 Tax=Dinoponera quadriceps TaxID=609295 RepID=A0A6P3X807_DINQU|nr:PREDICTED: sterol regulatory element-binding protein cleavage-activating protein [Dinoponera quadriceps]XP_014474393.1 PREDICTED: sterol regulatory element-binding protein cleavage-activating protein [Dinoponera quadriceps]XP_014474394.1 PREDICTED: sterol regulatory element-binding protein cleavage-activating protein [Dinoponera quadriceps]